MYRVILGAVVGAVAGAIAERVYLRVLRLKGPGDQPAHPRNRFFRAGLGQLITTIAVFASTSTIAANRHFIWTCVAACIALIGTGVLLRLNGRWRSLFLLIGILTLVFSALEVNPYHRTWPNVEWIIAASTSFLDGLSLGILVGAWGWSVGCCAALFAPWIVPKFRKPLPLWTAFVIPALLASVATVFCEISDRFSGPIWIDFTPGALMGFCCWSFMFIADRRKE